MFSIGEKVLWNFYIADVNKTTYEYVHQVPDMLPQNVPIFFSFIIFENLINYLKHGTILRFNDGVTSTSMALCMQMLKLLTCGFELWGYEWLYAHRIIDLDWQSPWTWWAAALGVDFCYYWFHRALHEISFLWSSHQVHHSSEDYNLTTALRQSMFQHVFSVGVYQPCALIGIPFPALLVHMQLNLFYQFWIHSELISNLGPLEWILNTASHHRVHHGVNKWCLDKNYGGFLIIWDRIFGTFEAEKENEQIVYGLVSQPQSFDPVYLQFFYFKDTIQKSLSMTSWTDSFKALFHGPGWNPGTPRLGDLSTLPDGPTIRKKYDPEISPYFQFYLLLHFMIVIVCYQTSLVKFSTLNWFTALAFMFFIFFSLYSIGGAFDGKPSAPFLEALRCIFSIVYFHLCPLSTDYILNAIVVMYFAFSLFIWSSHTVFTLKIKITGK